DPPSAALVALLGREAADHRLLVVASLSTAEDARRSDALALLAAESREITLLPLGIAEVEHLCRSLFGDVPNVQLASHRLHAVSGRAVFVRRVRCAHRPWGRSAPHARSR